MDRLSLGLVTHRFDIVPVRSDDESRIVVRVVLRAQARRTVIFATRRQRRAIERVDLLVVIGNERNVKMRWFLPGLEQTQRNFTCWLAGSTPRLGDPSETIAFPSGSSALTKNASLAALSLTPNFTRSKISSPDACGSARAYRLS